MAALQRYCTNSVRLPSKHQVPLTATEIDQLDDLGDLEDDVDFSDSVSQSSSSDSSSSESDTSLLDNPEDVHNIEDLALAPTMTDSDMAKARIKQNKRASSNASVQIDQKFSSSCIDMTPTHKSTVDVMFAASRLQK